MMQLPTASAIPGPAWRLLQGGRTEAVKAHFQEAEPLLLPPCSLVLLPARCLLSDPTVAEMPLSRQSWGAAGARKAGAHSAFPWIAEEWGEEFSFSSKLAEAALGTCAAQDTAPAPARAGAISQLSAPQPISVQQNTALTNRIFDAKQEMFFFPGSHVTPGGIHGHGGDTEEG